MLAKPWSPKKDVDGWFMSEKLDGVRAVWDGANFYSRNENLFAAPDWFKAHMPQFPIDVELHAGRHMGALQQAVSTVKKKVPQNAQWEKLKAHVLDLPYSSTNFLERNSILRHEIIENDYLSVLPQEHILGEADLMNKFSEIIQLGGEGLIVKHPGSYYEAGKKSGNMLKLKTMYVPGFVKYDDAVVTGHTEGEGKYIGMVGALLCSWVPDLPNVPIGTVIDIKVGSGLTDIDRRDTLQIPVGTRIRFKYEVLTPDNKPFHPIYEGVRDEE
jgi:DNA ligase-1